MAGAKTFPGNPYDGHILHKQLTQTQILLENAGSMPKQVIVDLGFRGVDADNPEVEIIHLGKYKSLTKPRRRWLRRRQAVEPAIGHLKPEHRMDRAAGCRANWEMRSMLCCVRRDTACAG